MAVKVDDLKVRPEAIPELKKASAVASDNVGKVAVFGIAAAATLAISPWLANSMFADEGATLYSARLTWSNLWAQSVHVDMVLLPYYALVHFWMMLSGNIAFVRTLSLLAYFGTIVAVGGAGLRIAGRWCGIIAAVLTATSTILILKALNARPYELSALVVTLCAVALFKWIGDPRARWLWVFSLLSLLATAMQLFALLAPISMLIAVLVVRPRLIAQRLRILLAPTAFLAIGAGAWIIACTGEVGQVNWIANGSLGSLLTAEIRGPVIGLTYDFVILVVLVLAVAKVAAAWDRGVRDALVQQIGQDRDVLALTVGWAVLPTIILSLASFAHPIYANRYVTASAPGFALLVAFLCVRAFPGILSRGRSSPEKANKIRFGRTAATFGVIATVVLVLASLSSASSLQEDLKSTARYLAHHERTGDVIALPDHAITAAIDYYLARGTPSIPHWPQIGVRQRYVEGLDLALHPSFAIGLPQRVWIVTDYSVSGISRFQRALLQDGYLNTDYEQITGVTLLLYVLQPHLDRSPRIDLIKPTGGATVHGTYFLDAEPSFYSGVRRMAFEVTGRRSKKTVMYQATFSPFGWYYQWDTTQVADGTYSVRAIAHKGAGKSKDSQAVTIKVAN